MKRPFLGDQLSILYRGALVRARCDDVSEAPSRGPGATNLTIVSAFVFERGHDAQLMQGSDSTELQVLRVTTVGHHKFSKVSVVQFAGTFDA